MEHERGGEQVLLFLWKYNDFTCSLYISNYAEIQKFPLGGGEASIPSFLLWGLGWLPQSVSGWVGILCACV